MRIEEKSDASASLPDRKGRALVVVVIIFSLLLELILFPLIGNFDIVRLLLTLALVYFVYEGYKWARILMGILLGMAGILGLATFLTSERIFSGFLVLLVVMEVYYFVGMSILLFSKSAKVFLIHRRERIK